MSSQKSFAVSIVVPVYNVEQYLKRCLNSLAKQTLDDIEIILINDGSTDGSLEICEEYASTRDNWIVISKANEGQGIARNVGIKIANGEFIIFVDSDDWIEETLCEDAVSTMLKTGVDFANFGLDFINTQGRTSKKISRFPSRQYHGNEIFQSALLDKHILSVSWNKIYKRSLLQDNNIFFPPLRANEDIFFSRAVAQASEACAFINGVYYHALIRPSSTSRSMSIDMYSATKDLLEYEEIHLNLSDASNRCLFYAHTLKLWAYLIIQGSFRIRDEQVFTRCLAVAKEGHFYTRSSSKNITKLLSIKTRFMIALCQHPRMLRTLSRFATKIGIQPY